MGGTSATRTSLRRPTVHVRLDVVVSTDALADDTGATAAVRGSRRATVTPVDATSDCVCVDARPGNEVVLWPSGPTTLRFSGGEAVLLHPRDRGTDGDRWSSGVARRAEDAVEAVTTGLPSLVSRNQLLRLVGGALAQPPGS